MNKIVNVVTCSNDIVQVTLENVTKHPKYIANIFNILSDNDVNIDMISQVVLKDHAVINFTLHDYDQVKLDNALEIIKEKNQGIFMHLTRKYSKLYVEGPGMVNEAGVASLLFSILGKYNVHFYQITTSDVSISCLIDNEYSSLAVEKIKEAFGL